jgi:nitroimidazol reductase NimA-like FMN-containing flavoprotein (pyridoxamine 5'-phosphate oxidase superfamily)
MTGTLSTTPRSTIRRSKERARTDRADLLAVLDAGLICQLGFVVDGAPVVIPTGYGHDGDTLYLHGSSGAMSLRTAGGGAEVCVNVTLLDGIIYGRSVFHHSVNYRSAVIHGQARPITERAEKLRALRAITEHLAPGSWDYAREPTEKELAKTAVIAVDLSEAAVKVRTGPPIDDESDVEADEVWAGVLRVRREFGAVEPAPDLRTARAVPEHVARRAMSRLG